MKQQAKTLPELRLVGQTIRTNNKDEMNPDTSKIAQLAGDYWGNQVANDFLNRVTPGVTYAVYTNFESDEHGEYTYFIGEVVDSFYEQNPAFDTLVIPAGNYTCFRTSAGPMPEVVVDAWKEIWAMDAAELGGERAYIADFEVYDESAADPKNAVVDIYIGIKKQ
jgi:predicted transcriptional regulator YdeE